VIPKIIARTDCLELEDIYNITFADIFFSLQQYFFMSTKVPICNYFLNRIDPRDDL
jgi:hypothetical protein